MLQRVPNMEIIKRALIVGIPYTIIAGAFSFLLSFQIYTYGDNGEPSGMVKGIEALSYLYETDSLAGTVWIQLTNFLMFQAFVLGALLIQGYWYASYKKA